MMIYLSGRLTLFALAPLPLLTVLVFFFMRYMHRQSKKVQELFSVVTGARAGETWRGGRVVKSYAIADREIRAFRGDSERYMRESLRLAVVMSLAWPLIGLVLGCAILVIVWQGGRMVIEDTLPLGDLTAFLICTIMLAWPLVHFGWVLSLYQRGAGRHGPPQRNPRRNAGHCRLAPGRTPRRGYAREISASSTSISRTPALKRCTILTSRYPPGPPLPSPGAPARAKSTLLALLTREYEPRRRAHPH